MPLLKLGVSPALHTRIGLLAAGLVLTAVALLSFIAYEFQRSTSMIWAQRLNADLASYIVEHLEKPLLGNDGAADSVLMKDLAMHTMTVNPTVELYLLDADGRVLAHALEGVRASGLQVDIAPIAEFLRARKNGSSASVLGDDPKRSGSKGGFSAAALQSRDGTQRGYLYIVLYGEQSRLAAEQLERDSRAFVWLSLIVLAGVVGMLAGVLANYFLTRPLRILIANVIKNTNPSHAATVCGGDEITILSTEFERLNQRICEQITQLQDGDLQRRELMANLSHDMRTPLAGIQGYIELARQDSAGRSKSLDALTTALKHCSVMNKRINDLLMVARLEAGEAALVLEEFSLKELLYDVVHGLQARAQAGGVKLEVQERSMPPSDYMFFGDIGLLERLFSNLLDNALSFTGAGGRVWIELAGEASQAKICVVDTGVGMSAAVLAHAFDRHWSSRSSTGFGLAIVQRICRLHRIALRVESSTAMLTHGTTFELLLPPSSVNLS